MVQTKDSKQYKLKIKEIVTQCLCFIFNESRFLTVALQDKTNVTKFATLNIFFQDITINSMSM